MRHAAFSGLLVAAASLIACSGSGGDQSTEAAVRDSAGVTITEYPAGAWDSAPRWAVTTQPLATIGGNDDSVDLTNSQFGTLLADGRVIAASMQPAQVYVFNPDGTQQGTLG